MQVGSGLDESMDELGRDDEPYEDLSSDADADGDIFVEDDSSLGRTPNGKGGKKKQRKGSLSSGKKAGAMSKQARRLKEAMGPKGVGKAHIGKKGPEPKATSCTSTCVRGVLDTLALDVLTSFLQARIVALERVGSRATASSICP